MSDRELECRMVIEEVHEYAKWRDEIPKIKFPSDWEVRMVPPTTGAIVRFIAYKNGNEVSVYLDCYEKLGCFGGPHWEIYPDVDDNNSRFSINSTDELLDEISKSLNKKV